MASNFADQEDTAHLRDNDSVESVELPDQHKHPRTLNVMLLVMVILLLCLCVGFGIALAIVLAEEQAKPVNVILMISDGFGPASETMARNYVQHTGADLPVGYLLPLDEILVGSSRTRSSSSLVTDSAAGATAFSCGIKSYNAAIAVDDNFNPCPTILEAAKLKGMKTALVATSRITHATPASFAAHVVDRDMEEEIAAQELETRVDLMFGGGLEFFLPASEGGLRADGRNLVQEAAQSGYITMTTREAFNDLPESKNSLPVLGLFAGSHMAYEIDRDPATQPSLSEMAMKALNILKLASPPQGFFIMIEGSRIDHAAHAQDPASHLYDILEYQNTVGVVMDFIDENPDTLLISVSDHETGGLSVAYQVTDNYPDYAWYPDFLTNVKNSSEVLAPSVESAAQQGAAYLDSYLRMMTEEYLGLTDVTEAEYDEIKRWANSSDPNASTKLSDSIVNLINVRAQLGWSTHGHSGVDVNLYAYGMGAQGIYSCRENTDIGHYIVDQLGLDLSAVTRRSSLSMTRVKTESAHADVYHQNIFKVRD